MDVRRIANIMLPVCLVGCGGETTLRVDAGTHDASARDASRRDANTHHARDAGRDAAPSRDAGTPDATIPDAHDAAPSPDAGVEPRCEATSCSVHGVCSDSTGEIVCDCDERYEGPDCSSCAPGYHSADGECVTDCAGDDCGRYGVCEAVSDGFACVCHPHYGGERCDRCAPPYADYPTCEALAECVECAAMLEGPLLCMEEWCSTGRCDTYIHCVERTRCAEWDERECYCGEGYPGCFLGGEPTGPCRAEAEALAGTDDPIEIGTMWYDCSTNPLAAVNQMLSATLSLCPPACWGTIL